MTKGRPVSPQTKDQYESYKKIFSPADGMKKVEDFAKWLFGGTSVMAALGAGLSNSAFSQLDRTGQITFGLALVSFAASLVCATLSLAPYWKIVNVYSLESMQSAMDSQFRYKQRTTVLSACLFGLALLLAGSAPLLSKLPASRHSNASVVAYDVDLSRKITLSRSMQIAPMGYAEMIALAIGRTDSIVLKSRKIADSLGRVQLRLAFSDSARMSSVDSIMVQTNWEDCERKSHHDNSTIFLKK